MDMELLSRMVGELILDHDRVGLPGVGTFVADMVPATFSDRGYTINPPYRRLSFTDSVLEEDLLVDFYASENSVGRPAAKAYIAAFLAEMKGVLMERKAVTFPGLGRLRATRRDAFFFVPAEDLDIYPEGFGLEPVSLKTHVETEEEVSIAVSDLASILEAARQEPGTEAAPEPAAEPEPEAEPEPAAAPDPEAVPEPAAEPAAPVVETVPAPEKPIAPALPEVRHHQHRTHSRGRRRKKKRIWIWPAAVIGAVVLLLAAFMILARVAPDFVDSFLYTEEELRIINAL